LKRICLLTLGAAFAASLLCVTAGTANAQTFNGNAGSYTTGNVTGTAATAQQLLDDPSAGLFTFTDVLGLYNGDNGGLTGSYSGGQYTLSFDDTTTNKNLTIIQGTVNSSTSLDGIGFIALADGSGDTATIQQLGNNLQASYTNKALPTGSSPAPELSSGVIFGGTLLVSGLCFYVVKRRSRSTIA